MCASDFKKNMSAFDIAEISACLRRIEVAESARGGGRRETNGGGVGSRQDALAEKPQDGGGGDGEGSKKEVRGWRRREVAPWKTSADRQLAWTRRGSADRQPTAARRARRPRQVKEPIFYGKVFYCSDIMILFFTL